MCVCYMRTLVPEAGISGRDKWLHPTVAVGCNYLSLPEIPAFGTKMLLCFTICFAPGHFYDQFHILWVVFECLTTAVTRLNIVHGICKLSVNAIPHHTSYSKLEGNYSKLIPIIGCRGSYLAFLVNMMRHETDQVSGGDWEPCQQKPFPSSWQLSALDLMDFSCLYIDRTIAPLSHWTSRKSDCHL